VAPAASISNPIASLLRERGTIVLDGALATELERHGADLRDPLWSAKCLLDQPELIRRVHLEYFEAGADVATCATYQASFEGFARRGLGADASAQLMRDAVALAADARREFCARHAPRSRPLIVASVGPYGAVLADGSEYRGHYAISDRELAAFHRERLGVLCASGADALACETFPCLREALIVAQLLEELGGLVAWMSFACQDGCRTWEGDEIGDCAAALRAYPQVVAVGVNCTRPELLTSLLQRMRASTDRPLVVYPNSGERYEASSKRWAGPHAGLSLAAGAKEWQAAGAQLIGGCCRTTPDDIRALRAAIGR
jgi:homocysteine S-methyltransferase